MSFFFSQSTYPDTIRGVITKCSNIQLVKDNKYKLINESDSICKIDGEWTGFMRFNDFKYFQYGEYTAVELYKMNFILPSDSSYREDLNYFIKDDEENAQKAKEKMEELQREDRKLRAEWGKSFKK